MVLFNFYGLTQFWDQHENPKIEAKQHKVLVIEISEHIHKVVLDETPENLIEFSGEAIRTQCLVVTPDFPKKTKCIPICMPGSSFMHIVTYK
jgi:hypothetical protein